MSSSAANRHTTSPVVSNLWLNCCLLRLRCSCYLSTPVSNCCCHNEQTRADSAQCNLQVSYHTESMCVISKELTTLLQSLFLPSAIQLPPSFCCSSWHCEIFCDFIHWCLTAAVPCLKLEPWCLLWITCLHFIDGLALLNWFLPTFVHWHLWQWRPNSLNK